MQRIKKELGINGMNKMSLVKSLKVGKIPSQLEKVAEEEKVSVDSLRTSIICGRVVIPKNLNRNLAKPVGIGNGLRTKINANIGTSKDYPHLFEELSKLKVCEDAGADTVMDLSTGGDLDQIRREILKGSKIPVGTVPIYQAAIEAKDRYSNMVKMTADDIFSVIEKQARDGVDFMTVHSGINRRIIEILAEKRRVTDVVSRGGVFIIGWMIHNDKENPLFEQFDRLLEIAVNYDITLSLGDGMRPGSLADAGDQAQIEELKNLGTLVDEARASDVQVIVEGPGHVPIDKVVENVKLEKELCKEAPFYVLGPIVTDVAPGYDEITSAIGGTLAAANGADFICYVTPREHLGLPTQEDVRRGVIAARIAAHAADIAKGVGNARAWDRKMSEARRALDWEAQINLALDSAVARRAFEERSTKKGEVCSMCGEFCALNLIKDYFQISDSEQCQ